MTAVTDAYVLIDQLHKRMAASLSAATTLQLVIGCPDEDALEVAMWVASDPSDDSGDLDRETHRLREFEESIYSRMRWEGTIW